MKILGIIGIRSKSQGVKNKNIKLLLGKPLVSWIISEAKKSKYINRLLVSTDSKEYASIVNSFGAETPFLRPDKLSTNYSPEFDYIKHALEFLKKNENYEPDIIVRLMATIPMQTVEDIDNAIAIILNDKEATSAVVIAEARQHPLKALKLVDDKRGSKKLVSYFNESGLEVTPIARQNYDKAYFRANVIATKMSTIKETDSLTGELVRYHIIPQERAVDIDNDIDFLTLELLMEKILNKKNG